MINRMIVIANHVKDNAKNKKTYWVKRRDGFREKIEKDKVMDFM